ncbi:NAD(P)/FAD-dependent oxidoreductase [Komagataeibacter rhaeticus]|nr:NAD(P)/FAD-dependent oxidoreductase [Komagataeibacter rhaeticus]
MAGAAGGAGVRLLTRHRWEGWDAAGRLRVTGPGGPACWRVNATVLAMGAQAGRDWGRMVRGVSVCWGWVWMLRLCPANCGFVTDWGTDFTTRFAGMPLRGISLALEGGPSVRGEAVVTQAGIEGGAVYALSAAIRDRIARDGHALVHVDLRPALDVADIATRLARVRARESLSNTLRKALRLAPEAIALLREGGDGPPPRDPTALARRVKAVPVVLRAPAALDRAISVAGGIAWSALDERLMLTRAARCVCRGRDAGLGAPTGGYLLQGCMATGRLAGEGAWEWLRDSQRGRYPSAP